MSTHRDTITEDIKINCKYPGCEKEFRQQWIMKDHMATHDNIYKLYCNFPGCDKKYNTRSNLEVHMRKHAGVKPFECELCHKKFISKWNMSKHQKISKCSKKASGLLSKKADKKEVKLIKRINTNNIIVEEEIQ